MRSNFRSGNPGECGFPGSNKILSTDFYREKVKYVLTPTDFVAGAASTDSYRLLSTKIQHRNVET